MPSLKGNVGTPLAGSGLVDPGHLAKLRALSVTTVEELLGLIQASAPQVQGFLEVHDLAKLQADAAPLTHGPMLARLSSTTAELQRAPYSLGAAPPATAKVEKVASAATFDEYAAREAVRSAPPSGEETSLMACFGPIRDQGGRGTCVAHAVCAVLECRWRDRLGDLDLSEQFLYSVAKLHDGDPNEEGTRIEVASERAVIDGVCLEATWPYVPQPVPGNEGQGPPARAAIDDAGGHRAEADDELPERSVSAIQQSIQRGKPVAISIPVYDNWASNPTTALYGFIPMPLPGSILKGGHAMCAMGFAYDEDFTGGGYLILRNSWSTTWASDSPIRAGYGALPFEYFETYGWESFTVA